MKPLVDVYPYRLLEGKPQFLILKRAEGKRYADEWRMVAGKVENCEASWQGGLRELREETGLFPDLYWAVPSLNQFYDPKTDHIHHIPVFGAEVTAAKSIKLNEEHNAFQWIESEQIATFIHWPEQQRLMQLVNRILTTQKIIDDWKIPL